MCRAAGSTGVGLGGALGAGVGVLVAQSTDESLPGGARAALASGCALFGGAVPAALMDWSEPAEVAVWPTPSGFAVAGRF
jgi:hypothetical protein